MAKTPVSKPFAFPKPKPMNTAPPVATPPNVNKMLRAFTSKPVVKPVKVTSRALTKAPADPLRPPRVPGMPITKPQAANPLAPLKTYLP